MRRVFLLLGLLGLASSCLAEVLPLPALLDGANSTPLLRAAEAEGAALEALQRQREAEAGWQWFASAGTGRYRELVTEEVRDDYYGRDLALGLRHPLLGSLKRQQDALRSVEDQRQQQQARLQLARLEQRLALRSAYADWWRAQEELRWCDGIAEPARRAREQLAARLREGWLLASEARLQDGRWQALERRCAAAGPLLEETRYSLQSLSGQTIEPQSQAQTEALAASAQPLSAWLQQLERHPRLQERRGQLRQAERNRQSPWYAAVDLSFSVAQSYEDRSGGNEPGNGLVASISLSAPFDPLSYGQARGDEGAARHQMALAQLDAERERLVQGLGQALRAQRAAAEDLLQARQQLEAAALAVREQRLRRAGDVDQAYLGSLAAPDRRLARVVAAGSGSAPVRGRRCCARAVARAGHARLAGTGGGRTHGGGSPGGAMATGRLSLGQPRTARRTAPRRGIGATARGRHAASLPRPGRRPSG